MQTKMLVKKPELAPVRTNNQKNKPAANKKNVRTTDYKKFLQIMLNDPDAITREEFMVLQSAIGYRQTVKLREEAKQRKKQKKLEQANVAVNKISLEKLKSEIKKDSDSKKEASETKNNEQKTPLQMKKDDDNTAASSSGMQHNLQAGLEKLSGVDLSDVKVHQNSDKPQQVGALAYTQGNDIHIAPGQEKHLPHEGWHAVQQKQGRVKPTLQMKSGEKVNDDEGLEKEADVIGRKLTDESRSYTNVQQSGLNVTQPELNKEKIIQRAVSNENTYVVKKGDTLGGIAIKYNISEDELAKLNNIKDKNIIKVGQVLKLPLTAKSNPEVKNEGNTYVVKKGDTLGGIAIKYNVSEDELAKLNNIKDKNTIKVGQVLKLPSTAKSNPEVKSEGNTTTDKPEKQQNSSVDNNKKNEDNDKATNNDIISKLKNDSSLGLPKDKKDAMLDIATILLSEGYKSAFVSGVLGNVLSEGAAGHFESSAYISHPENEPDYLKYMDKHYNYRNEFSGKNISEVGIKKTYDLLKELQKGNYKGKFGLGACQWTGSRTMDLIKCYIEECGLEYDAHGNIKSEYYPKAQECRRAENKMVVKELNGGYHSVYNNWLSKYSKKDAAAYYAGWIVCKEYEKPKADSSDARGKSAARIYKVMMGLK